MILIVGNNISSVYLSAYFEKQNIDYCRVYTHEIADYTFYLNDITQGIEKQALDILGIHPEGAGETAVHVLTGTKDRVIDGSFENFIEHVSEKVQDKEGLNNFAETISLIGREWKEVVDSNFSIGLSMYSNMARMYMKGYKDFLFQTIKDNNLRSMFLSFLPRTDVSLNTAAGYIYNQLFDGSGHENRLEELTKDLLNICSSEKQIRINSFDRVSVNQKEHTAKINEKLFFYDTFIKLYDRSDPQIRLITYYVESEVCKNTCTFLCLDNMYKYGIEQMILWKDGSGYRLDVYYNAEFSEIDVDSYVKENVENISISHKVGYAQLKKQYGNGNFAGWAFNVKENVKNPIKCSKQGYMDLSMWGNAHFTCGLVALANIEQTKWRK